MVLRLRDYQGKTNIGTYASELLAPDTDWHQLSVTAPIMSSRDDLDLNVYMTNISTGVTLKIDDVQETCK
jgi:hypothetical protein